MKQVFFILWLLLGAATNVHADNNDAKKLLHEAAEAVANDDPHRAIDLYARVAELYERDPDGCEDHVQAFKTAGDLCYQGQRYVEALDFYTLALEAARKSGDTDTYYRSMGNVGLVYGVFGDNERALSYFNKVLEEARRQGNDGMTAKALGYIIAALCNMGRTAEAKAYFRQMAQTPGNDPVKGRYKELLMQGFIATAEKKYSASLYYYRQTLDHIGKHRMEDRYTMPVLLQMANNFSDMNQTDSALHYFTRAEQMAKRNDMKADLAEIYSSMKSVFFARGDSMKSAIFEHRADSVERLFYNADKMRDAQNRLHHAEERVQTEEIHSLNNTILTQAVVIISFVLLAVGLVVMLFVNNRQRHRLADSYRLLIEKHRQLIYQQQQSNHLRERLIATAEADGEPSTGPTPQEQLLRKINEVMDSPQFVFDADFSMMALCREVGSNKTYVSALINDTYKKSFKALLNERRIQEAMRQMADQKKADLTVKDIAYAVGYNSPTSFIIAFKNIVGMTPAVYRTMTEKADTGRDEGQKLNP